MSTLIPFLCGDVQKGKSLKRLWSGGREICEKWKSVFTYNKMKLLIASISKNSFFPLLLHKWISYFGFSPSGKSNVYFGLLVHSKGIGSAGWIRHDLSFAHVVDSCSPLRKGKIYKLFFAIHRITAPQLRNIFYPLIILQVYF